MFTLKLPRPSLHICFGGLESPIYLSIVFVYSFVEIQGEGAAILRVLEADAMFESLHLYPIH